MTYLSVRPRDKTGEEPGWGTFDDHFNSDSLWGFDSESGKVSVIRLLSNLYSDKKRNQLEFPQKTLFSKEFS